MAKLANIFKRYPNNPILSPTKNRWESASVFNAAATAYDGKIVLLYRAVGDDKISQLGLAESKDGFNFTRMSEPISSPQIRNNFEQMGLEDPRITLIDGKYYIIYVGASIHQAPHPCPPWSPDAPWRVRVSAMTTTDFKNFQRLGVIIPRIDSKDPALFPQKINGQFHLIHRKFPDIWLAIGEFNNWHTNKVIIKRRPGLWDGNRIGAGPPPIKTKDGWLLVYHGVDDARIYRQGVVLLDLADPSKVIARCQVPFLEPQDEFEKIGLISNAIFSCGMVQKGEELIIYYGAADKVLCAGTVTINDLLGTLEKV